MPAIPTIAPRDHGFDTFSPLHHHIQLQIDKYLFYTIPSKYDTPAWNWRDGEAGNWPMKSGIARPVPQEARLVDAADRRPARSVSSSSVAHVSRRR
jgi:hypothetical protein